MKIEYIYHSGFTVETDNYFLVFDYYKGDIDLKDKNTIVFSSHGHKDHYNPEIFKWSKNNPDIHYVLSYDIERDFNHNCHIMKPYDRLEINDVEIRSFGSTDIGLSFLVKVDGYNIFFAGDLNWWYWEDDSEKEKISMEKDFKEEIRKIKEHNIDLAFFPVDSRLKENYSLGGKYFIDEVKPKIFVPIHFWNKFTTTFNFAKDLANSKSKIIKINKKNQVIEI